MGVERATSIQKISLDDSIVAWRRYAVFQQHRSKTAVTAPQHR
jgi:hypothetical protein